VRLEGGTGGSEGFIDTTSLPADHIQQPNSWDDGVGHQNALMVLAITALTLLGLCPDLLPSSSSG
jgi:hypothetical protein